MNEWTDEKLAELPVRDQVRQRGLAATRLEAFCDAAFAFSVTILVISTGGVPGSYAELLDALRDVPAFAASFAAIAGFWAAHRMWSQRYGLEDRTSTFLSLAMVFVMLIYVYPLKMVFGALASWLSGARCRRNSPSPRERSQACSSSTAWASRPSRPCWACFTRTRCGCPNSA